MPGEDGGRRIVLVTDRPISFWEAANQPRSIDYPFTLIELRLNRDGEGEGKMSIATKITGNRDIQPHRARELCNAAGATDGCAHFQGTDLIARPPRMQPHTLWRATQT